MVSWLPVKSYAMPKRGPKTIVGQMYPVSAMPSPARLIPLSALPVPGIGVPIAACVFAAPATVRICPVRGSLALRRLPVHVVAPLLQPATYRSGACDSDHCSGKKFDICWNRSCCGCCRVNRMP